MLTRKLLGYRWELDGKKTKLIDTKNGIEISLDKVRLMSFMKFAVNVLDKMRIDEIKKIRKQVADQKARIRAKKELKNKVSAKAMIEPEQNTSLFDELPSIKE